MSQAPLPFAAFTGIDWAGRKHDISLHIPGQKREPSFFRSIAPCHP